MTQLRVFSYGGGVQSTAALVLAAQGRIDFPVFLFANVGADSEHPDTVRYISDIAIPYAAAHGIALHEVQRHTRKQAAPSLLVSTQQHPTEIAVPIRNAAGAPFRRLCTKHYKTIPISRWTKSHGATSAIPAQIGLGISIDEWHRANSQNYFAWHVNTYPLLDLRLNRADCVALIVSAGLPVPRKSACWFCPFTRMSEWVRMKQEDPALFAQACAFEADVISKRQRRGLAPVYLTRFGRTLAELVGDQAMFDIQENELDFCESGHCMT